MLSRFYRPALTDPRDHAARHAFVAALWRETRDLQAVRIALGHSHSTTSETYLRGLDVFDEEPEPVEDKREEVERIISKLPPDKLRAMLAEAIARGGA